MQLYFIVSKHPSSKTERYSNYRLWVGFESEFEKARSKSAELHRGYKIVTWGAMSFRELIYLLPFVNRRQTQEEYERVNK